MVSLQFFPFRNQFIDSGGMGYEAYVQGRALKRIMP